GTELLFTLNAQCVAPVAARDEPSVLVIHRYVGRRLTIILATQRQRIDATEDPGDDVGPLYPVDTCVNAESGCTVCGFSYLCGVDEHLRRDATHIQAGAAEDTLLADCHAHVFVALVENRIARAGSDDGEVVMRHQVCLAPVVSDASVSAV